MFFPRSLIFALGWLFLLLPREAQAQDCGCDHEVAPETPTINGTMMGVLPGETVCIQAGARDFLRIDEMIGTADAPIVIKNCGGQVVIDNSDRGYGLTLDGSAFVQITGTGEDSVEYGFRVRASKDGPDYSASCIIAGGLSSDYEIDHIEAYECGFAGVSAKTDPSCEDRDLSDFVQRNSRLHHLYLHDTGGEGIYFGSTGFPSRKKVCDDVEIDVIPHTHEGVWIHDNIIEDTGWDGAQIGVSPKDCFFYRNRIARVGLDMMTDQMQGLQIGGGSRCEITDNFISHGPAIGIIILDAADTLVANNVIVDFVDGIYINDRDSEITQGAQYRAIHNTVVSISNRGITIFGNRSQNNGFINNFIVAGGMSPLGIGGDVDAVEEGNLILDALADADFVDAASENFQLIESSPAVDAGVSAATWGVEIDQLGAARDETPDPGAFEFGAEPPEVPVSPPGPGENPVDPGGGDGDGDGVVGGDGDEGPSGGGDQTGTDENPDDGGCSCRLTPRSHSDSGLWCLAIFVGALSIRRRLALAS
jgi:Right handed beta helix region